MTDVPSRWRRLDPRMLVVGPLKNLMQLLPFLLVVLLTGRSGDLNQIWFAVGGAAVVVLAGVLRWRTTRYRITDERVELHTGWLRRERRSVPRDRIRTVDLTASPLHRVFGLSVVQVGSATGGASALDRSARMDLDAVSTAEAERLRRELLDRTSVAAPPAERPAVEIARLDWSWLRFAPLTFSSLAGVGAVVGAGFNLLIEAGVDPRDIGVVDDTARRVATAPLWVGVGLAGAALLVVAGVGSLLLFAERWSGYRLTREPDGSLRVRHGLLTTRSLSVSHERLRGAQVSEPLLLRAGRGAQTRALSTGLREGGSGAIAPPAPRAEAHRLAAAALQADPAEVTRAALVPHPRAALRRRLTRAVLPAAALVVAAWLVDEPDRSRVAAPAPGRRVARRRPLPRARPRAHRPASRHPARWPAPAHGRPAARRGDRLDVPAERLPAARGRGDGGGRDGGGPGRLRRARRRGGRRRRARRRHHPGPAQTVCG